MIFFFKNGLCLTDEDAGWSERIGNEIQIGISSKPNESYTVKLSFSTFNQKSLLLKLGPTLWILLWIKILKSRIYIFQFWTNLVNSVTFRVDCRGSLGDKLQWAGLSKRRRLILKLVWSLLIIYLLYNTLMIYLLLELKNENNSYS